MQPFYFVYGDFLCAGIIKHMQSLKLMTKKIICVLIFAVLILSSCSHDVEPLPAITPSTVGDPTEAFTPTSAPTATFEPFAAVVNGEGIPLKWLDREVERYIFSQEKVEFKTADQDDVREIVLNDLIDQFLFAQAASEAGTNFTDEEVLSRFDALAQEVDLDQWMLDWGYSQDELLASLRLQILVTVQRDLITASVPEALEQVELRQILALTEAGANRAFTGLKSGTSFEDLANEFSPTTGGYLGWVPRGYLLFPEVEEAVFNIEVGTYTEIIETRIGYHIVFVIARDERPLTTDARFVLERQALYDWLEQKRDESIIEILI